MKIIEKWNTIINWQQENLQIEDGDEKFDKELNSAITSEEITAIEKLSGEVLPEAFKVLYSNGNGQPYESFPLFFYEKFMSSQEIVRDLEYAGTLIKPEIQNVLNPEKSEGLLKKIIEFYINNAPKHTLFGLQKSWYKIEFSFGVSSYEGPYLYKSKSTSSKEREIIKISSYKPINDLIKELYELEYESYNWDEIELVVYANGKFEVERTNYNFDNEIPFTSTPENAIKKKYFNHKWIPIFSDHGGNFIGIDLDPDINGKKGQIINFGRDEEKMFVIADDLECFFDFIIDQINKNGGESFKTQNHLHDILRELKKY
jgi:cell wall assembly regulator SMI1